MKKNIILGAVIFILASGIAYSEVTENKKVDSKITKVTVYSDRALITREAVSDLKPGVYALEFSGLPMGIEQSSIRVGSSTASIKILGIETRETMLEKPVSQKIAEIEDKVQFLRDEIQMQEYTLSMLRAKEEFLLSLKAKSAEKYSAEITGPKFSDIKDWKEMLKLIADELDDIYKKKMDISIERRKIEKKIQLLDHDRGKVYEGSSTRYATIAVSVEALSETKAKIDLSYVIGGAGWVPLYDARVISDKGVIELVYYGTVYQRTGENWNDVELSLSTAKPTLGGNPPFLSPRLLTLTVPAPAVSQASSSNYNNTNLSNQAQQNYQRYQSKELAGKPSIMGDVDIAYKKEKQTLEEQYDVSAEMESKSTAVAFKIKKKETIPSDGNPHKTTIAVESFDSKFSYQAVPRMSKYAFIKAVLTNKDMPLLPGQMNVFFDQDFVGESSIKSIAPGEKFDAFFGVDESIKISRSEDKKEEGTSGGFLSSTKNHYILGYKVAVQNLKKENINITIIDRIPVSHHDELKINIEKINPVPKDTAEDGITKWELELGSGEKKEIYFEYKMEYPKDKILIPSGDSKWPPSK